MLNYAVPVSLIPLGLQQTDPDTPLDSLLTSIKYRNLQEFSEWAMLDLNQRPPPCKRQIHMLCVFAIVQKYLQIPTFPFYGRSACSLLFTCVVVKLSSDARLTPPWSNQLYLPPYSPDLNSIDEASSKVTYGVRRRFI